MKIPVLQEDVQHPPTTVQRLRLSRLYLSSFKLAHAHVSPAGEQHYVLV